MGSFDSILDSFPLWHGCDSPLVKALQQKNYPAIYAALRRLDGPLKDDAFPAFFCALFCSVRAFQAVMEHCSPKELSASLCSTSLLNGLSPPGHSMPDNTWWSAVNLAAYLDKPEALDLLLKAGCSPNRASGCTYSPLEAAVLGRSLKCTQRLLEEPGLNTTVTKTLLTLWAQVLSAAVRSPAGAGVLSLWPPAAAPRPHGGPHRPDGKPAPYPPSVQGETGGAPPWKRRHGPHLLHLYLPSESTLRYRYSHG